MRVEVAGRHIEPLLQVDAGEKQRIVSRKSGRVQHVSGGILFVAGKRYVSGHGFFCKT